MSDFLLEAIDGAPYQGIVDRIAALLTVTPPTALARAAGLLVWKRAFDAEHGEQRGGDHRSAKPKKSKVQTLHFWSAVAEKTGLGRRAIFLDIQLAEDLGPDAIRALWSSNIADNGGALRTYAQLDDERRRQVLGLMQKSPGRSFAQILIDARLRAAADSKDGAFNRLHDAWEAAPADVRRRFLHHIGVSGTLADMLIRPKKDRAA